MPVHGHRPIRTGLFLTVFCLGLFMTLLDITIVNIAIPDLVTDLSTGLETVLWVTSAYSMVYAVMLITAGRLGDIHGPRQLFLIGLALFTVASLASGMSQSPGQLIAFRAVQGLGAALLAPQGLAMITSILPEAKRGGAFAAIGIMSGLGVLLGPTLGGFIVTHLDWRWIFFLNVPIGIVAFVLAIFYMPDVRPGRRHRLDLTAVALLTVGLLFVVFGLIEGQRYDWGTIVGFVTIPMVIAIGCVFLGIFVWWQIRTQDREPLLPFAIFADRTYSIMVGVLLAMGFAMVGVFLPMTIYYQSVLGLTAVAAGLVIGTQSLAMMVTSGIVGGASGSGKINMKWVLFAGLLLFAGGVIYVIAVAAPGQLAMVVRAGAGGLRDRPWLRVDAVVRAGHREPGPGKGRGGGRSAGHAAGVRLHARDGSARRPVGQPAGDQPAGGGRGRGPTAAGPGAAAVRRRDDGRRVGQPVCRAPDRPPTCRCRPASPPMWPGRSGRRPTTSSRWPSRTRCGRPCWCRRSSCCWPRLPCCSSRRSARGSYLRLGPWLGQTIPAVVCLTAPYSAVLRYTTRTDGNGGRALDGVTGSLTTDTRTAPTATSCTTAPQPTWPACCAASRCPPGRWLPRTSPGSRPSTPR